MIVFKIFRSKTQRLLFEILNNQEYLMADFIKLESDVAALAAKVDEMLAKVVPPPVDEQPKVDAVDASVVAIIAKIPA